MNFCLMFSVKFKCSKETGKLNEFDGLCDASV